MSAVAASLLFLASTPFFTKTPGPEKYAPIRNDKIPDGLQGIDIEDKRGAKLPLDLPLVDQDGRQVLLGDYYDGKRPVILVLAYYQCPMLCSIVLNGLDQGMRGLAWTLGDQFRVVTVSFDPRDTTKLAAQKRAGYVEAYGRPVPDKGWDFLTGAEADVKKLADTVGFHYRWDDKGQQFAHAAGVFVTTPGATLARVLFGISFPARDLRLALVEASEGKLGGTWDKVLLFCFHYDAGGRGYTFAILSALKVGALVTVLIVGLFLVRYWRREAARARAQGKA